MQNYLNIYWYCNYYYYYYYFLLQIKLWIEWFIIFVVTVTPENHFSLNIYGASFLFLNSY